MREAARAIVELIGVGLIIAALALVYVPLALLVGGTMCVIVANFYMGDEEKPDAPTH